MSQLIVPANSETIVDRLHELGLSKILVGDDCPEELTKGISAFCKRGYLLRIDEVGNDLRIRSFPPKT